METYMPVAPSGGLGGGDSWAWIILLLLLAGGNGFGGMGGDNVYPWLNNSQNINDGFRSAAIDNGISDITAGLAGISNQLCNGFSGVEIGANARQINDMQTAFAMQSSINAGFNGVQSQLSQCCCDNRLATVQTQNIVQTEGAATRLAIQEQTQAILDKMCEQEIEQLRAANVNLQNQLNMANLSVSQTAQTAAIETFIASRIPYSV